jgi:hypothetical protein
MSKLTVIKEKGTDNSICYIVSEPVASKKVEQAILDYELINTALADDILTAYSQFVDFGGRDTPLYVFTSGNTADWYIAQVEVKENNAPQG